MESIPRLQQAINYMENHLLEDISYEDIAKNVYMSSYHFHRIFRFLAGMSATEYLRNRRLSLAGQELQSTDILVIDAAYKYGYDTPESFSKAFSRFHGVTPKQAKCKGTELRLFNPLILKIIVEGGNLMNYKIENRKSQKFIALVRTYPNEVIGDENDHSIPDFWTECYEKDLIECIRLLRPEGKRGLYGLCGSAETSETHFCYGIGIIMDEDTDVSSLDKLLKSGYAVLETKPTDYVVFQCFGSNPGCITETWKQFFKEFIPQTGYIRNGIDYEYYPEKREDGLFCELWIPVKKGDDKNNG